MEAPTPCRPPHPSTATTHSPPMARSSGSARAGRATAPSSSTCTSGPATRTCTGGSWAALDARNRVAERYSLTPLLAPRAVAVVGAGRDPAGIGHAVLRSLLDGEFDGPVYPVNPRAVEVAGRPAYPSVGAIGAPVDLAVV